MFVCLCDCVVFVVVCARVFVYLCVYVSCVLDVCGCVFVCLCVFVWSCVGVYVSCVIV